MAHQARHKLKKHEKVKDHLQGASASLRKLTFPMSPLAMLSSSGFLAAHGRSACQHRRRTGGVNDDRSLPGVHAPLLNVHAASGGLHLCAVPLSEDRCARGMALAAMHLRAVCSCADEPCNMLDDTMAEICKAA